MTRSSADMIHGVIIPSQLRSTSSERPLPLSRIQYYALGYIRGEQVGRGAFGVVYKCVRTRDHQVVAVKESVGAVVGNLDHEITILKSLGDHDHVVQMISSSPYPCLLVLEYLDMNLEQYIHQRAPVNSTVVKRMMVHILRGLTYIHSRFILHRDLKPHNLLIDVRRDMLKIADFGSAVRTTTRGHGVVACTLPYRAPNVGHLGMRYSFDIDMWSVGCIFAELLRSGLKLFDAYRSDELLDIITLALGMTPAIGGSHYESFHRGKPFQPILPDHITTWRHILPFASESAKDLFLKFIQFDPKLRLSAREALRHAYFNDDPMAADHASLQPSLTAVAPSASTQNDENHTPPPRKQAIIYGRPMPPWAAHPPQACTSPVRHLRKA